MSESVVLPILLVRHGEPDLPWPADCSAVEFDAWSAAYRSCGLVQGSVPSVELRSLISELGRVSFLSSPLNRAVLSAETLSGGKRPKVIETLVEARLPPMTGAPGVRSADDWVQAAIRAYNAGHREGCESQDGLRLRAESAARALLDEAATSAAVVAVGHGLINRLVTDALLDAGATSIDAEPGEYWRWQMFSSAPLAERASTLEASQ